MEVEREPDGGDRGRQCPRARPAGLLLRLRRAGRPRAQPAHAYPGAAPDPGRVPEHDQDGPGDRVLGDFSGSLQPIRPGQNLDNVLPQALDDVGSGLRATPLPLAAGDWASLTAKPIRVAAGAAASAQAGAPPQLQVSYRTSFTGFAQAGGGHVRRRPRSARRGGRGRHHADGRAVRDAPGQPADAGRPVRPGHPVRHRHRAATPGRIDLLAAGRHAGEAGARAGQPQLAALLARRGHRGPGPVRRVPGARSAAPVSRCSWSSRSTPAA